MTGFDGILRGNSKHVEGAAGLVKKWLSVNAKHENNDDFINVAMAA